MTDGAADFSFSGVKTSVVAPRQAPRSARAREVADIAASFQATVVKMLVRKTVKAALHHGIKRIVLTGGVAANGPLRAGLEAAAIEHGLRLHVPPRHLCTDNAAMITAAGAARLAAGERASLTLNAVSRSDARVMNFEAVLAGLPDAVIAVDAELRIVFWNSAAEVLTERSARRAEGRFIKEVFSPDASVVRRLGETLATGESRSEAESFVERGDGRRVAVSIVTARSTRATARSRRRSRCSGISPRIRQLEAEVRRGETLAAAGRMAVGLAHEVRNPLGAIRGAVQLLKRELGPDSRFGEYTDVLTTEVDAREPDHRDAARSGAPGPAPPGALNLHQLLERVAVLNERARASAASCWCAVTIRASRPSSATRTGCSKSSTTSCATRSTRWETADGSRCRRG